MSDADETVDNEVMGFRVEREASYLDILGLAFFRAPSDCEEEDLLSRALDLACEREGVDQNALFAGLCGRLSLLAEHAEEL